MPRVVLVVVVAKFDLFSAEGRGFESKSVIDTRATTDKNDPFLNKGFKHGKKWVDKNGAKCNMGFGRITKNTALVEKHAKGIPDIGPLETSTLPAPSYSNVDGSASRRSARARRLSLTAANRGLACPTAGLLD